MSDFYPEDRLKVLYLLGFGILFLVSCCSAFDFPGPDEPSAHRALAGIRRGVLKQESWAAVKKKGRSQGKATRGKIVQEW